MEEIKLTRVNRKLLKKQQQPTFLLATGMFLMLTLLNFLFHYKDVVLGMDMIERPPLMQLIAIQITGTVISAVVYFAMARSVLMDLRKDTKWSERTKISAKYFKRIDGDLTYFVKLKNGIETHIDKSMFPLFNEEQLVIVEYAFNTRLVFDLQSTEN
jgi:hypothetical protein